MSHEPYKERDFSLPDMSGFSQKQISEHLKLYAGYVKNINGLAEDILEYSKESEKNYRALSELHRRYAFEWDGMRMHEYYFDGMGGTGISADRNELIAGIEEKWSGVDSWSRDFKAIGTMRGIGWVSLCHDFEEDKLINVWVSDHEIGLLAGTSIILTMDVWEHAYLIDYPVSGRSDYIEAFFKNLDWKIINERYARSKSLKGNKK